MFPLDDKWLVAMDTKVCCHSLSLALEITSVAFKLKY